MVTKKRSKKKHKEGLVGDTVIGAQSEYNPVVEDSTWTDDVTEVLSGKAIVYRTKNSGGRYYVRLWLPAEKKYYRKSLKTKDKTEAIAKAEQLVIDALAEVRAGFKMYSLTFGELMERYDAHQEERVRNDNITQGRLETIRTMMRNFIRFVGADVRSDGVKATKFQEYFDWRREEKPNVTNATLRNEQAQIQHFYKWASDEGFLNRDTKPKFKELRFIAPSPRPSFTTPDYKLLYQFLRTWHKGIDDPDEVLYRQLFREFVLLKANIGMRFRELRETQWKNLSVEGRARATQSIVYIFVPKEISKTKRDRTAVGARGDIIDRLKKLTEYTRDNDYLFTDPRTGGPLDKTMMYRLWHEAMVGAGLDKREPPYSFYSLRHYFATMRLQEGGVDVFALAKIMGTSVKNIEDHYGQILVRDMGDELTRRRKR